MLKEMVNLGRVEITRETEKAVRVTFGTDTYDYSTLRWRVAEYWFPKRLVRLETAPVWGTVLYCPWWLAREKRLV